MRRAGILLVALLLATETLFQDHMCASAETSPPASTTVSPPPATWVDPQTGHRLHRLTDEPGSTGLYFNLNAYTPDDTQMVYSAPDGIRVLDLPTGKSQLVVPGKAKPIAVGRKTAAVYFIDRAAGTLCSAAIDTGKVQTIAKLPPRGNIASINADQTLAAGTYIEGTGGIDYGENAIMPPGQSGPLVQPLNKAAMMAARLAAHLPLVLFTIDLKTGELKKLLHSTDWVNHLLFSPTDPTLLMYCHEGPWEKVDRIWTIRTDGSQNQLIHTRTMAMEIAGHEFWGLDGKTIWYDLQRPKGEDFFLAAYNVDDGQRRWFHLQRDEWSIHFNVSSDGKLMCGDGGDQSQVARATDGKWIELFHPQLTSGAGDNDKTLIHPGVLHSEHLVDMSRQDYRQEPNVRFSPDNRKVIFTSNMFGPSYIFAVDVDRDGSDNR